MVCCGATHMRLIGKSQDIRPAYVRWLARSNQITRPIDMHTSHLIKSQGGSGAAFGIVSKMGLDTAGNL